MTRFCSDSLIRKVRRTPDQSCPIRNHRTCTDRGVSAPLTPVSLPLEHADKVPSNFVRNIDSLKKSTRCASAAALVFQSASRCRRPSHSSSCATTCPTSSPTSSECSRTRTRVHTPTHTHDKTNARTYSNTHIQVTHTHPHTQTHRRTHALFTCTQDLHQLTSSESSALVFLLLGLIWVFQQTRGLKVHVFPLPVDTRTCKSSQLSLSPEGLAPRPNHNSCRFVHWNHGH